jgi:hypothetical protein
VLAKSITALQQARGRKNEKLKLDALKLSHHGSANATIVELLALLQRQQHRAARRVRRARDPADRYAIIRRARPTAERTMDPARMFTESLTPRPELGDDQAQWRTLDGVFRMSVADIAGLLYESLTADHAAKAPDPPISHCGTIAAFQVQRCACQSKFDAHRASSRFGILFAGRRSSRSRNRRLHPWQRIGTSRPLQPI